MRNDGRRANGNGERGLTKFFFLPFRGAFLKGEFVHFVLMGVEGFDRSVAFAEIEDDDFAARRSNGEGDTVRHKI